MGNDTSPRWSPCGTKVAFLSDRDKDKNQLYILSLEGGEATKVTSVEGGVRTPAGPPTESESRSVPLTGRRSRTNLTQAIAQG
jgi:Tol biopolymer transport system component